MLLVSFAEPRRSLARAFAQAKRALQATSKSLNRQVSGILIGVGLPTLAGAGDEPVVARVRDGACQMVVTGQLAIFGIEVSGLVPNETLIFESVSNGERMVEE